MYDYLIPALVAALFYAFSKFIVRRPAKYPPVYHAFNPFRGPYLLREDPVKLFKEAYEKCGPTFTLNLLGRPITFITDYETSTDFWKMSEKYFDFHRTLKETRLSIALKWQEPDHYSQNHLSLNQVVIKRLMSQYESAIPSVADEISNIFARNLRSGQRVDFSLKDRFLTNIVVRSSARVVFGPEDYQNPELLEIFTQLHRVINPSVSSNELNLTEC